MSTVCEWQQLTSNSVFLGTEIAGERRMLQNGLKLHCQGVAG